MTATASNCRITALLVFLLILVSFNTFQIHSISKNSIVQSQEGFKEAEQRYVSLEATSLEGITYVATGINIGNHYILTAGHLVEPSHDPKSYRIMMREAEDESPILKNPELLHFVAYDKEKDLLLLLRVTPHNPPPILIANSLQEGDPLISFSNRGGLGRTFHTYTVSRFRFEKNATEHYQSLVINGQVLSGQSGGGLFTADGSLAGIHLKGNEYTDYGVSIASWEIKNFLDQHHVPYTQPMSWTDRAQLFARFIGGKGILVH